MQRVRLFFAKKQQDSAEVRDQALSLAATYLPAADQLNLRAVNRAMREAVQRAQRGPYQTRAAFAMALSGLYSGHGVSLARTLRLLARSWQDYNKVMQAASMQPAMLYRLNELKSRNPRYRTKLIRFEAGEDIRQQQRIYQPPYDDHFWAYNQVWMLAQIHKCRAFAVLSDITSANYKSISKAGSPSAFAKEIYAAILAGYTAVSGENETINLLPPTQEKCSRVTILDFKMKRADIKRSYEALAPLQNIKTFRK